MRTALLLCLAASVAAAQGRVTDRACDVASRRSDRGGVACGSTLATFEFAPSSSAGMGVACAGTTPTAATGGALVFTRASSATCDKSNGTTGILPGDLVTVTSNQPRISTVGTTGLKLGIFDTRTNTALRSQEFDNVAWLKDLSVTVSANDAACPLAPDNTQTMDLITFAGLSGTGVSQTTASGTATSIKSVYLSRKTSGAACTLNLRDAFIAGAGVSVAVPASGAVRLTSSLVVTGASGPLLNEATAGDCVDACVWGIQDEVGFADSVSPYIPTTSAAATRATETARVAASISNDVTGSIAFSYIAAVIGAENIVLSQSSNTDPLVTASLKRVIEFRTTNNYRVFGDGFSAGLNVTPAAVSGTHRAAAYWTGSGSTLTGIFDGVSVGSGAFTAGTGATQVLFFYGSPNNLNGWIYAVCIDPSSTRCR